MNDENPILRQVANVITTLAFFALIGFLAHSHALSEQSIAWILGAFTVGTSGVKLSKNVAGASIARFRAVRPPPNYPPSAGGGDNPHERVTRQLERPSEPDHVRGQWGPKGKGPGGIIPRDERVTLRAWAPSLLVGALAIGALVLALLGPTAAIAAGVP